MTDRTNSPAKKRRRPLIAINCDYDPGKPGARIRRQATLYMPYIEAVVEAGGLPLLVPPSPPGVLKEYLARADGILFTGGLDYPPSFYSQTARPEVVVQPLRRAESDRSLMRLVLDSSKPAMGICAGLQLMNITKGGALIQHLPNAPEHKAVHAEKDSAHSVSVLSGTRLRRIFGAGSITVNSSHHQAADPRRLAPGLRVAAKAPDGTIEALELQDAKGRFFLFVQWHPERIPDSEHRRRLFRAFVAACG
ncbi:MAG: gamma-glutamyl-gamma-aminobutyrate hydrolase family protein [Elusimicrobia bacterium]|nr:gamma-glutamyl-gamma-aminobutyrate hydrolase family protein [Elusimicrobiota bacterium]